MNPPQLVATNYFSRRKPLLEISFLRLKTGVAMNSSRLSLNKLITQLQSQALVLSMAALLGWVGWLLGGQTLSLLAVGATIVLYYANPAFSPAVMLRAHRAQKLQPHEAPQLQAMIQALANRAGLSSMPSLYVLPGSLVSAFTVGSQSNAAIAISRNLLRYLDQREIAAVLAHEISHIRHNDIRIMGFAGLVGRLTAMLSLLGQMLLLLNLPMMMFGDYAISWTAILLLIFAPTVSMLLQLALSRTREYHADAGAVELTGEPESLAAALVKIDRSQRNLIKHFFFPMRRQQPGSNIWHTHPPTKARVRRLLDMRQAGNRTRWQTNPTNSPNIFVNTRPFHQWLWPNSFNRPFQGL